MKVALVGQPNCGKSTVFNAVAGYRAETANYAGTTIEAHYSRVNYNGENFELMEFPGLYSLMTNEPDEQQTIRWLLDYQPDVLVNVVDASVLCRSLDFTLELLELGLPMVVGLNMMDEARRKGVTIDVDRLASSLGVPVVPTVAARGEGIPDLFRIALEMAARHSRPEASPYSRDVEAAVTAVIADIVNEEYAFGDLPPRLTALRLLGGDAAVEAHANRHAPALLAVARDLRAGLERDHGRPPDVVLSSERHALCLNLFEDVSEVKPYRPPGFQERLDGILMHPVWGYVSLAAILGGFFLLVFGLGGIVEEPVLAGFGHLETWMKEHTPHASLVHVVLIGVIHGFAGGVAMVLPYLVPFFLGLALLEDFGYIPRAAFLMDTLMHRIGLHGKAVIPFVMGYGCTVPAVMAARILDNRRERFLTALFVNFVPCAARTTIIFAVVGAYLGAGYALFLYALNIVVIAVVGKIAVLLGRDPSPGMVLEIPSYKIPEIGSLAKKVWFRLREFIIIAWPILIAGSVVLSVLGHYRLIEPFNRLFAPFTTGVLGLPDATSWPLLLGILRKELTVIMLVQALDTMDLSTVLTTCQMLVFAVFALFYVPCLATLAALRVVAGRKGMLLAAFLTAGTATALALFFRLGCSLMGHAAP